MHLPSWLIYIGSAMSAVLEDAHTSSGFQIRLSTSLASLVTAILSKYSAFLPSIAMTEVKRRDTEFSSISASNGQNPDPNLDSNNVFVDPVLEKQITSKFDKFMMPQMAFMIVVASLDRSNIGSSQIRCLGSH